MMAKERQMASDEKICINVTAVAPEPINEELEKKKWCFTRILEARQRDADCSEIFAILMESCLVLTVTIIEILIGLVYLILGIVYLNDCPIQKSIPITLIVFGVFFIIIGITLKLVQWKCCDVNNRKDGFGTCALIIILVTMVAIVVTYFYACFAVFSIVAKVETTRSEQMSDKYCNLYLYGITYLFLLFGPILFIAFFIWFIENFSIFN